MLASCRQCRVGLGGCRSEGLLRLVGCGGDALLRSVGRVVEGLLGAIGRAGALLALRGQLVGHLGGRCAELRLRVLQAADGPVDLGDHRIELGAHLRTHLRHRGFRSSAGRSDRVIGAVRPLAGQGLNRAAYIVVGCRERGQPFGRLSGGSDGPERGRRGIGDAAGDRGVLVLQAVQERFVRHAGGLGGRAGGLSDRRTHGLGRGTDGDRNPLADALHGLLELSACGSLSGGGGGRRGADLLDAGA